MTGTLWELQETPVDLLTPSDTFRIRVALRPGQLYKTVANGWLALIRHKNPNECHSTRPVLTCA